MIKVDDTAEVTANLFASNVPTHMHGGLILWLQEGIEPGGFMMAVLCNDLREACARADSQNRYRLYDFIFFLTNYAPMGSWGSRENCRRWAEMNRETRAAK